jgi:cytochrome P450
MDLSQGTNTEIPGPGGVPVLGVIPELLRRGRFEYLMQCWRDHGDIVRLPLLRLPVIDGIAPLARVLARDRAVKQLILVNHPDGVQHVLQGHYKNFIKGANYDPVRTLMGQGLVTSSGDLWLRQRKLIQPAFGRGALQEFLPAMRRCTDDMLDLWAAEHARGEAFDVYPSMMALARRIIGMTMFGADLGTSSDASAQAITDSIDCVGRRMEGHLSLPLFVPTPDNLKFRRAQRVLDEIVYDIIARARRGDYAVPGPNLLKAMIAARDDASGEAMSDRQLRDEVLTLYIAGHETTALALTWTLDFLTHHPEVHRRVRDELAGDPPTDLAGVDRWTYTRQVLDEALRLRPPAWALARETVADDELLGHRIPAGSVVLFLIQALHRHPRFWPDPDRFDPDRFTPERVEARHKFAYLPFLGGPRVCIGKAFSIYETMLALALMLRRFDIEAGDPGLAETTAVSTLRPRGAVRVRLRPRASA